MDVTVSPSTPLPGPGGGAEAGSVPQDALSRCVGPTGKVGLDPDSWGHRPLGWAEGQPSALTGTRMHAQACKSPRSRRVSRHRGVCWGRTRRCLQTPTSPPRPVGEPTVQAPEHPPDGPPGHPHRAEQVGPERSPVRAAACGRKEGRKPAAGKGKGRGAQAGGAQAHAGSRTQSLGLPPSPEADLGVPAHQAPGLQAQGPQAGREAGRLRRACASQVGWLSSEPSLPTPAATAGGGRRSSPHTDG